MKWFLERLIVLVACFGLVNIPNAAAQSTPQSHHGIRCVLCGGGPGPYDNMQKANVTGMNAGYQNRGTKAQLLAAAADLSTYATAVNDAGGMPQLQAAVLDNLEKVEQIELNASEPYTVAQSFGAIFPQSALQTPYTKLQNLPDHAKDVEAAIAYIQSYGMFAFFQEAVTVITNYANTMPEHFQPGAMNLPVPAQIFVDGATAVGLGLTIFGGPLGVAAGSGMLLGCAILVLISDF